MDIYRGGIVDIVGGKRGRKEEKMKTTVKFMVVVKENMQRDDMTGDHVGMR